MKRNAFEYTESGDHLPEILKDFRDQKDIFKAINHLYNKGETKPGISFEQGQIYVIDFFLWFMAQRGYTLQKSRAKVDFLDIQKDITNQKEASVKAFADMFKQ